MAAENNNTRFGEFRFLDGQIVLYGGDCLEVLKSLPENSLDACVTDPPYELGFMGRSWDKSGIAFTPDTWAEVLRVLKPGGHMVAFGAPKNYHRLACAIEDAGFEIRDSLMWVFGQGFPKSQNVALAIDKTNGAGHRAKSFNMKGGGDRSEEFSENGRKFLPPYEPQHEDAKAWQGWGTALKPAYEPIVLARKPLSEGTVAANVLRWGTGAINVDATRIEGVDAQEGRVRHGGGIKGAGTSYELPDYKAPMPAGRWPANLCHSGEQEVVDLFPSPHGAGSARKAKRECDAKGMFGFAGDGQRYGDEGSAARFFYCAKASKHDRAGSKHPTVKPVALIQWLIRMVTPPGGTVIDPFAGTGTTGQACINEGFKTILVEKEIEYQQDIKRRINGDKE